MTTHRRPDVKAGRKPRRRDPENGDLQMPGSRDSIRQILVEREAVEAVTFHSVVRGNHSHQDLDAPESHHNKEILQSRSLRWRWLIPKERVFLGIRTMH